MFLRKTDEEVPLGQHTDLWWTYIYTYIYIYMYIELNKIYICTMVGWDSTTNLFIYIYIGFICGPSIHGQKKSQLDGPLQP